MSFFKQINLLINWSKRNRRKKSTRLKKGRSVDGRPAYGRFLLFKMLLLGICYGLSDEKVEEVVNDGLSIMRFCDLDIEDSVLGNSVWIRFRSEMTEKKAFGRLMKKINRPLSDHKVIIKNGAGMLDASITDSPLCLKGKSEYESAEDRKEERQMK